MAQVLRHTAIDTIQDNNNIVRSRAIAVSVNPSLDIIIDIIGILIIGLLGLYILVG